MTAVANGNGNGTGEGLLVALPPREEPPSPPLTGPTQQLEAALVGLLAAADADVEQHQAALDERIDQRDRLRAAVDALQTPSDVARKAKERERKAKERLAAPAGVATERPPKASARSLEKAMAVLLEADEPMTGTALSVRAKMSSGTGIACVRLLHQQQRLRITGRSLRGGVLYAPMPEEIERYKSEQS